MDHPASPWLLPIIVSVVLSGVASIVGFLVKRAIEDLTAQIKQLQSNDKEVAERVQRIEVMLPREYVTRGTLHELQTSIERLRETFVDEIRLLSAKLDTKQDKPSRRG